MATQLLKRAVVKDETRHTIRDKTKVPGSATGAGNATVELVGEMSVTF
jgi:hypothetical protein